MNSATLPTISLLICTIPEDHASRVSKILVEEKWVACVNLLPKVTSIYIWEGRLCEETEWIMVLKTATNKVDSCIRRLKELHPYDVPEILSIPIESAYDPYRMWVLQQTKDC